MFTRELQNYQEVIEEERENYVTNKMREIMSQHYSEMKHELGFGMNMGDDEDHPRLEQVLAKIKPNMNPGNFTSFMHKKDNTRKDPRNRAIARKFQAQQEEAAFKQTTLAKTFQSARIMKNSQRAKTDMKDVDEILNAFEVVNKDAIKQGVGGGIHGPASKMLNGI